MAAPQQLIIDEHGDGYVVKHTSRGSCCGSMLKGCCGCCGNCLGTIVASALGLVAIALAIAALAWYATTGVKSSVADAAQMLESWRTAATTYLTPDTDARLWRRAVASANWLDPTTPPTGPALRGYVELRRTALTTALTMTSAPAVCVLALLRQPLAWPAAPLVNLTALPLAGTTQLPAAFDAWLAGEPLYLVVTNALDDWLLVVRVPPN